MRVRSALGAVLIAMVALSVRPPVAQALSEEAAWGVVPSPNRGTHENELAGLSVLAPDDIWAVGRYNSGRPPTVTGRDTLSLHWDGTSWGIEPTPNPTWAGADFFTLEDSAAVSSDEVWAVGYAEDFASLKSTTLVERWDGTAWRIVRSPNPGGPQDPNMLWSIDVASATEVWAVGEAGYPERALILRWDGSRWRNVPNRCAAPLAGVDVRTATDIWAVGSSTTCHYDGSSWRVVPSPQPRPRFNEIACVLADVSAFRPDDVWTSGYRVIEQGENLYDLSIVEHWDGSRWTLNPVVPGQYLGGIQALSATDVWAVGTDGTQGVVAHDDGTGWKLVPSPTPGGTGSLADVEAESAEHLWAVGAAQAKTMVLEAPSRFDGTVTGHTNVVGATVSWFGPESGSTETDIFGDYAVAGLPEGTYQLIATYPGCTPAQAEATIVAGQTVHQDLTLGC